jgi:hypothetical protein
MMVRVVPMSTEEARMQSVYGFDCYEASNNAVEDIEETRESLLDSAYALTPAEERELEAEEVRGRLWCHMSAQLCSRHASPTCAPAGHTKAEQGP